MYIYANLIILGLIGIAFSAYTSFQLSDPKVLFILTAFSYIASLFYTFIITKRQSEKEFNGLINSLRQDHKLKIRKLKREHDTITLEKTIRDGTKTLIKNAVDYFKIENIKNEEQKSTAAMKNLQLDKYGQIIELLADFSLILPDLKENQEIVEAEIKHQIAIYQIDEKNFASFLQRIMDKYIVTVNKKIREKNDQDIFVVNMKACPQCMSKMPLNARFCRQCGYEFFPHQGLNEMDWLKKGKVLYRSGKYQEALSVFTNAIDLNPKSGQAYYNRGVTYEKLGNNKRAFNDLNAAAQLGHKKAQQVKEKILDIMDTQEWEVESVSLNIG